jgi:hypothetical protein
MPQGPKFKKWGAMGPQNKKWAKSSKISKF